MNELKDMVFRRLMAVSGQMSRRGVPQGYADAMRGPGRVLAMLKLQPDIPTRNLSYLLGIRQQSLNEQLMRMERQGYVERRPSETDRRVMVVHLTEAGRAAEQLEDPRMAVLNGLTEEELTTLNDLLEKVLTALESEPCSDREARMREDMGDERFEELWRMGGHRPPRHPDGFEGDRPPMPPHGHGRPPMPHGCPEGRPPMPPEFGEPWDGSDDRDDRPPMGGGFREL